MTYQNGKSLLKQNWSIFLENPISRLLKPASKTSTSLDPMIMQFMIFAFKQNLEKCNIRV